MPAIRHGLILSTIFLFLAVSVVDAQNRGKGFGPPKDFPPDGKLKDWGNGKLYSPDYSHLYDNEAQWLDNAVYYEAGKVPPGGDPNAPGGGEEPLSDHVVHPDGVPMGSGYNLISGLACYDPDHKGGTYWLAMDLPGPTNDLLSEGFYNNYVYFYYGIKLYPPPFDVDCNEDQDVVDTSSYYGSIVGDIDDHGLEEYTFTLWVAGDYTQGWNYFGSPGGDHADPYDGPGFPIVLFMGQHLNLGKPYGFQAYIPKKYLIDKSKDLDLLDIGGKSLAFESTPNSLAPGEYDIEVEVRGIWKKILPLIDRSQLEEEVTKDDCGRAYIKFFPDTCGDESGEDLVILGLNAVSIPTSPPPPWVRKAW